MAFAFPFATGWMGENHYAALASAAYGFVLLMTAVSYFVLQQSIIATDGPDSVLKQAIGSDWKGKTSPLLYIIAIIVAFRVPWAARIINVILALIWLIPDRRIERTINKPKF